MEAPVALRQSYLLEESEFEPDKLERAPLEKREADPTLELIDYSSLCSAKSGVSSDIECSVHRTQ